MKIGNELNRWILIAAFVAVVPFVLCVPDDAPRRAHWSGGLSTINLDAPYALAFDVGTYERTAHSVQHRAVGFTGRLRVLLSNEVQ